MYTTNLRKAEDSVMLTIPPGILDAVRLAADTKVNILVA
jgi:antitoxin component of MazEF toxin-antitoxin module